MALVLVPQSMAYAELAGLPPVVGLFAGALPPLLAAPFVSSPYLQTGPVALTALLTFGALEGRAPAGSVEYLRLAALLALVVGVTRLVLGLIRLGAVAYLMSDPVLSGFTTGAAVLIVSSQLPTVFDVEPETSGVLGGAAWTLTHPDHWSWAALGFGALTLGLMVGGRRLHPLFPGVLVAVVAGVVISRVTAYDGTTIGELPGDFVDLSLDFEWGSLGGLILPGMVIALVGYAEPASIARTFAVADRMPWSANREMVGQGVANVASAVSGGFPVGGSFSRSSLNRQAGGRTAWSGAITGAVMLALLPVTPLLEPLPRAVLGAIVLAAVASLIRVGPIVQLWRDTAVQGAVATGTLVATLAFAPRVERGVLVGIGLAIAGHLYREMRFEHEYGVEEQTLRIEPRGVIWFASAHRVEQALVDTLGVHPDIERVEIDLGGVGRLDYTGAGVMARVVAQATAAGIAVAFENVRPGAERALAAHLGGEHGVKPTSALGAEFHLPGAQSWRTKTARPRTADDPSSDASGSNR